LAAQSWRIQELWPDLFSDWVTCWLCSLCVGECRVSRPFSLQRPCHRCLRLIDRTNRHETISCPRPNPRPSPGKGTNQTTRSHRLIGAFVSVPSQRSPKGTELDLTREFEAVTAMCDGKSTNGSSTHFPVQRGAKNPIRNSFPYAPLFEAPLQPTRRFGCCQQHAFRPRLPHTEAVAD